MIPISLPLLIKILFPLLLFTAGFVLAKSVRNLDIQTLAACCLFIFLPALLFRQAQSITFTETGWLQIIEFKLIHTLVLYLVMKGIFYWQQVPALQQNVYFVNIFVVSTFALQGIQPFMGEPAQAVPMIRVLMLFHLLVFITLGIYFSYSLRPVWRRMLYLLQTPFLYTLAAGLWVAQLAIDMPFEILSLIDALLNTTFHLALIICGLIGGMHFTWQQNGFPLKTGLLYCLGGRLLLSPLVAVLLVLCMNIESVLLQRDLILASAVPTGSFPVLTTTTAASESRFTVICILTASSQTHLPPWLLLLSYFMPLS